MTNTFASDLLTWYAHNKRSMPWRSDSPDPYRVWISEIMLQQTQVAAVIPYFERWMQAFPHIGALAEADQEEVLKLWEGLGYYSRARNLHKAAIMVMSEFDGVMPNTVDDLRKLPGIGAYTAGAIGSIAYGLDVPLVDGNVKRVFARVFEIDTPINTPAGEKEMWAKAETLVPAGQAGDYNQALMDLGATICRPKNPLCLLCPVQQQCAAQAQGLQGELPVKKKKKPVPHYDVAAAVIQHDGKLLIAQRPQDKLLGGMWEFPGGKQEAGETLPETLVREIQEELAMTIRVGDHITQVTHAYTHFKITLDAFFCEWVSGEPQAIECADWKWVTVDQLTDYPMGKVDRTIAAVLQSAS